MKEEFYNNQETKRKHYLNLILDSKHSRKLIIAGPGTGKTYTFGQILKNIGGRDNLALTFINKLVDDMGGELGDHAEVKTFHAYCIKLLHEKTGRIILVPYLTYVIKKDAEIFGLELHDLDGAFQRLEEDSKEVAFYLKRGNYYEAISFNDSVYRLFRAIKDGEFELPNFTQIVVDEFQDFNPLEVALIKELEQKGPILIVGDDDQAVYNLRNSSSEFLKSKYNSGDYAIFQLPYCSRCPRVVVEATHSFINSIKKIGGFKSRIDRPFFPYLEDKKYENKNYPKIIVAQTTNIACLSKFILKEIQKIPDDDITESYEKDYPTVLIVGQRQYLNPLTKKLKESFDNIASSQAQDQGFGIANAYDLLVKNIDSNLGWRLLAECLLPYEEFLEVVLASKNGISIKHLLKQHFVDTNKKIVNFLTMTNLSYQELIKLKKLLKDSAEDVINHFYPSEPISEVPIDETKPIILVSSFEGCKGLSAGHVFIVGLNNGLMPRTNDIDNIDDYDCCKFIVAMTRTKKQLFLLSNKWDYAPGGNKAFRKSFFFSMIPPDFLKDRGFLKSIDLD